MCTKLLLLVLAAYFCMQVLTEKCYKSDEALQTFIDRIEQLVLNTTDRALYVTRGVYLNLSEDVSLQLPPRAREMLQSYIQQVDTTVGPQANYTQKRQLLQRFRNSTSLLLGAVEQLNSTTMPQTTMLQCQLISNAFYNDGRNSTDFDNLYLEFVADFGRASEQLWKQMSEQTAEKREELLEILDEISNETQLAEKDKLFDEFIELYLFKSCQTEAKDEHVQI